MSYKDKATKTMIKVSVEATISENNVDKWIKLLNKSHIASQQLRMGKGRERGGSGSLRSLVQRKDRR